jgi:hypothetical protein
MAYPKRFNGAKFGHSKSYGFCFQNPACQIPVCQLTFIIESLFICTRRFKVPVLPERMRDEVSLYNLVCFSDSLSAGN